MTKIVLARLPAAARAAAVALFLAIAVFSVLNTYRFSWIVMRSDRITYDDLTPDGRVHAPGDNIPLRMDIFDWYRQHLRPGDRYFLQVKNRAFGTVDYKTAVETFGRFYLLPAVLVDDPLHATVILTWDADPHAIGLPYTRVDQAGRQLIFAARLDRERLGLP